MSFAGMMESAGETGITGIMGEEGGGGICLLNRVRGEDQRLDKQEEEEEEEEGDGQDAGTVQAVKVERDAR
ncbi:hypothetical protein F7725_010871 [Dissostichus mawsoni]|uniref:Uncharacterized protein n=1 Tax=Dissostichus mawsoni TaxID=36200 RepID=A0A7J5Z7U5_DISMA|nr:hypothetical protein F7725_010871 [Dissostichus mawsoni]